MTLANPFSTMGRFRHVSCLDIDVCVAQVMGSYYSGVWLTVRYWNRHMKIFQGELDLVFVKRTELDKWSEVNE